MFDFVITNTYLKRKISLALAPLRQKYKNNFDELFKNNNNPKKIECIYCCTRQPFG